MSVTQLAEFSRVVGKTQTRENIKTMALDLGDVAGFAMSHPRLTLAVVAVLALGGLALYVPAVRKILLPFWRLITGGLVFRNPGQWDSTWSQTAPPRPDERPTARGEQYPRTAWGRMPGARRMAYRWAIAAFLFVLAKFTLPTLIAVALVGMFLVTRRVREEVLQHFHASVTGSFVEAVAPLLGQSDKHPREWIAIPSPRVVWTPVAVPALVTRLARKVRLEPLFGRLAFPMLRVPLEDDDAQIVVQYPASLNGIPTPELKARAVRMPGGEWEVRNNEKGLEIVFKHPKRPPSQVWYDQDAAMFPVDEIPIGQGSERTWITLPLKKLTPHGVMSATTGWCKTTTANLYIAHVASKGAFVLINDPKRVGYMQAFGNLPNIQIRTTVEGWATNYDQFIDEMERRYQLIEQFPEIKDNPELYFRPWFLVNDERGSLVSDINDWWKRQLDDDGKPQKGMPLPLRQEKKILWQARAAGMYVVDFAQQANLQVFLDSDGRDQRMWRLASGPQTRSSWMMMFPGISRARAAMKKGRAHLGIGVDSVTEIQLAQISDKDARALANSGSVIAEKENGERDDRIRKLYGASVPPGTRRDVPGETAPSVPGQSRDGGTDNNRVDLVKRNGLEMISGGGEEMPGESVRPPMYMVQNNGDTKGDINAENTSESNSGEKWIVGLKAAADHLGLTEAAFIQARKRSRQTGGIPGETQRGGSPAWRPLDLTEWQSQRPRAGA